MNTDHLTDISFDSLGLTPTLMQGLADAGFTHCTPIQAATLPTALAGKDVAGQAQTGTGKSAAFLLATMHRLMENPIEEGQYGPFAVILAPTRELAIQIYNDAQLLGARTGLFMEAVYGGTGYEKQRHELELGVDIIIGTPGRIIDFYKQKVFSLKNVEVVVLDEADRMFDLGFISDIRYLLRRMPEPSKRLNMLFSATLSHRVMELAYEHMNNAEVVKIEPEQVTAERVRQTLYHVAKEDKPRYLISLLKQTDLTRTIVFVNTKRAGDTVLGYLLGNDFDAEVLSGDIPQKKREKLLERFQSGELPILVATDVAARGLHIPGVTHVVNYDLPQDAEDYVHRIGRTARAGASGDAISLACDEYVFSLPEIEQYIGSKIPVEAAAPELADEIKPPKKIQRRTTGGRNGGRAGGGRSGNRGRGGPRGGGSSRTSQPSSEQ